jgi:hypothetical protein
MTLVIRGHRLSRQHQEALSHVERTAGAAAQLVCRRMGVRLHHTEIVVTTSQMTPDLLIEAHRSMFGNQLAIWGLKRMPRSDFGITTINKAGILVVINADRCRSGGELDKTLVHELAHAAQFSRPGGRDTVAGYLRANYRIDRMSGREARDANRRVAGDEREAERLESLAAELPAGASIR